MLDGCGSDVWVDDGIGGRRGLLGSDRGICVRSCLLGGVGSIEVCYNKLSVTIKNVNMNII